MPLVCQWVGDLARAGHLVEVGQGLYCVQGQQPGVPELLPRVSRVHVEQPRRLRQRKGREQPRLRRIGSRRTRQQSPIQPVEVKGIQIDKHS